MKKKKSNKLIYIFSIIAVLLITVIIVGKKKGFIGGAKGIEVEDGEVKFNTIIEKVSATGKIHPVIEIKISPDVSGEITDLYVEEGDSVVIGQLLLKIKPDNYKSMLDQSVAGLNSAKATLAQAESRLSQTKANNIKTELEFQRSKKLHDQKIISDAEFEVTEANYKVSLEELDVAKQAVNAANYNVKSAEARVADASENLNKTRIFAPSNGTISKLSVEKGERVVGTSQMAGTEMLRIANLNNMEVRVNVNENDIVRVALGDTANIEVDSYLRDDKIFKGIVTSISHTANDVLSLDAVTEFEVKIKLLKSSYDHLITKENPFPFRPGMTATVDIITEVKNNILTVPISAVTTRVIEKNDSINSQKNDNKNEFNEVVFIINEDNKVIQKTVKTGISDFDNIEVLDGLNENQKIVKGPYPVISKLLKDGDFIQLKKETEKKEDKESGVTIKVN